MLPYLLLQIPLSELGSWFLLLQQPLAFPCQSDIRDVIPFYGACACVLRRNSVAAAKTAIGHCDKATALPNIVERGNARGNAV